MSLAGSAFTDSGAVRTQRLAADKRTAPEHCYGVRAAIHPYRLMTWELQDRRSAPHADRTPLARGHSCHWGKYVLNEWRARTRSARAAWQRWLKDEWHWEVWMPDKFARVGACETGYGQRPGNWSWDSGTYVSAFGIIRSGYADFARRLGLPTWDDPGVRTPREQYLVAAALQREYGWGAWGCGGA